MSPEAHLTKWTVTLRTGSTLEAWAHGYRHGDGVDVTFDLMLSEAAAEYLRDAQALSQPVELGTVDGRALV